MKESRISSELAIEVLTCPMDGENDPEATTVREYLRALVYEVVREGEGFSGKRPFGNSGWEGDMPEAIVAAGLAPNEGTAEKLLLQAIGYL